MPIISGTDLASYPGIDSSLTGDQLDWIAAQINGLVEGAWQCPVDPVPAWVKTIALNAGARFAQNPRGLESYTTSVDDGSHTRRHRVTDDSPSGIYLTADELSALSCADLPAGVGTIWTTPTRPPYEFGWR